MIRIIFMIDDDEDDRQIFREAMQKCDANIQLLLAEDGIEALEILNANWIQPDVIFLDYNMPRMNGVECLKELKALPKTRTIPIVMYTTSGDRAEEKAILALGADYYMRKTNSFGQLCAELARLLNMIAEKYSDKSTT